MRNHVRIGMVTLLLGLGGALLAPGARGGVTPATFLYIHDNGTPNEVHAFSVTAAGALTELSGSPYATGNVDGLANGQVASMAYSSRLGLLFCSGGGGVSVFRVEASGTLTLLNATPSGGRDGLTGGWGIAVVDQASTTYVYASDRLKDQLVGFTAAADGSLTELAASPIPTGNHPDGLSARGNLVAVADGGVASVSTFTAQADGSLKAAKKKPTKTGAVDLYQLFLDPQGKFLYVPDDGGAAQRVFGFSVKAKAKLAKTKKSPYKTTGPLTVSGMAVGSKFLYTLGDGHPDIQIMARSTKGALTNVSTFDSQTNNPAAIALNAAETLAAVASDEGDQLATFTVNSTSGALTPAASLNLNLTNVGQVLFVNRN